MLIEVSTHGSVIRRDHESFIIQNNNQKAEFSASKIDAIMITGNALISSQAINLCVEKNIQLVIASYGGDPIARLWISSPGRATEVRRRQYINLNTEIGLKISMDIVLIKLIRQKKLLLDLRNNRQKEIPDLVQIISAIDSIVNRIKLLQSGSLSKSTLVGLEGACAAQYFKGLSSVMPMKWRFRQRSQHPAYDEFNAALNYIYGIGYSDVEKIIILSGLEPNSGFYHTDSYGKPTLSYDLMELVRAWLDRTVVSTFTRREAKENWFEKQQEIDNAIFLTKVGRKALLSLYRKINRKKIESEIWRYCSKIIQMLMGENESEKEYVLCNI